MGLLLLVTISLLVSMFSCMWIAAGIRLGWKGIVK